MRSSSKAKVCIIQKLDSSEILFPLKNRAKFSNLRVPPYIMYTQDFKSATEFWAYRATYFIGKFAYSYTSGIQETSNLCSDSPEKTTRSPPFSFEISTSKEG